MYSPTVTVEATDDKTFTLAAPWSRYNLAGTYGGTYAASNQAGSWFQYTASSRDLGFVGVKFSDRWRCHGLLRWQLQSARLMSTAQHR